MNEYTDYKETLDNMMCAYALLNDFRGKKVYVSIREMEQRKNVRKEKRKVSGKILFAVCEEGKRASLDVRLDARARAAILEKKNARNVSISGVF